MDVPGSINTRLLQMQGIRKYSMDPILACGTRFDSIDVRAHHQTSRFLPDSLMWCHGVEPVMDGARGQLLHADNSSIAATLKRSLENKKLLDRIAFKRPDLLFR
jgi:hypothetical protein